MKLQCHRILAGSEHGYYVRTARKTFVITQTPFLKWQVTEVPRNTLQADFSKVEASNCKTYRTKGWALACIKKMEAAS